MAVDFKGNLYKTAVKFPFGTHQAACARSAPAPPRRRLPRSRSTQPANRNPDSWHAPSSPLARSTRCCPSRSTSTWSSRTRRWSRPAPRSASSIAGLEKLVEKKDYMEFVYVAERICGICSFIHGQTYCQAIEAIMNVPVPPRALYLRTIWGELSRLHSHLLWLGLMADAVGFESLFMHSWRVREKVLEHHRGHHRRPRHLRLLQDRRRAARHRRRRTQAQCCVELDDDRAATCARSPRCSSTTAPSRTGSAAWACCPRQEAYDLGCVGPMLRASGVAQDMRQLGLCGFQRHSTSSPSRAPKAIPTPAARCAARSCSSPSKSSARRIAKMPEGEIAVKVTGNPNGEFIARTEQPRGEVVYYVKANGTKNLQRFRVRTPTFANLPGAAEAAAGLRAGRRARAGADDRPLHQLHRKVIWPTSKCPGWPSSGP